VDSIHVPHPIDPGEIISVYMSGLGAEC
jgi:hypothetical protein